MRVSASIDDDAIMNTACRMNLVDDLTFATGLKALDRQPQAFARADAQCFKISQRFVTVDARLPQP